jgi:hypothetical protein
MAMTLAALQQEVLSRLNESGDTPIGQYKTTAGGTVTVTTAQQITIYLNEAAAELARKAYAITGAGTFSLPIGTAYALLESFTTGDTSLLWAARSVKWNGVALKHCNRSALENWYPNIASDPNGTPLYWFEVGAQGVGVYPSPSALQTLTVNGLVIPPPLLDAAPTSIPTWLNADLEKLMFFYACGMMALKQLTAPDIQERGKVWAEQYTHGKNDLLARLYHEDPHLAKAHYPTPTA